MIAIRNLQFSYRSHQVFDNLTMEFREGKIYGLLGLNGSGKSTLLYLMSGLLMPGHGSVLIDGAEVSSRRPSILSQLYMVPEEFDLPGVTLGRYVKMYAPFYPRFSHQTLESCLGGFGMDAGQRLSKLSMGQKKKALMSFALATNTRYLLMDEPTNGLDIPSKSQFRRVVSSCMSDDRTIIVSTHQVKDVENLIDQISIIGGKGLLFDRPASEICSRLSFGLAANGNPAYDAIYTQPVLGGSAAVRPKGPGSQETPLDIELLFSAVLSNPQAINNVFK